VWAASGPLSYWNGATRPVGAILAFLLVEQARGLLPASFGFAAGAMLALLAAEIVPAAFTRGTWRRAIAGTLAGAALMLALSAALGV
jgi:zinc transporter, ZIP family